MLTSYNYCNRAEREQIFFKKSVPARQDKVILMKVRECIAKLKPYAPGKPIEELEREYGIKDSIKLASNENPIGPSPKALEAITSALENLHRYPDGNNYYLRRRLAEKLKVSVNQIVLGNGSNEIIELLIRTVLREGDEVIIPEPTFLMYEIMVQAGGGRPVKVALRERVLDLEGMAERISSRTCMIFVNNPNNPTGTIVSREDFEAFLQRVPSGVIVVIDEAYIEFVRDRTCPIGLDYLDGEKTVVTLRTFSKTYGLAGLRIGYGVMKETLAAAITLASCIMIPPHSAAAAAIVADHEAVAAFDSVPASYIQLIEEQYHIYYVHTSHGSQIMTGLAEVHNQDNSYDPPYFHEYGDDLGHTGDTSWAPPTRTYLDAHPECNMAMFSWCGGVSDNSEVGINIYLAKMEEFGVG